MNIFVLDKDIKKCAMYHNDKHCIKMILEYSQILCGVHHILNENDEEFIKTIPYKLTHRNHPCSIWARECVENYNWLAKLGLTLAMEYTIRYDKVHKSTEVLKWCANNIPELKQGEGMTEYALAMPDDCKVEGNAVESYRNYYRKHKRTWNKENRKTGEIEKVEHKWTNREKPEWMEKERGIVIIGAGGSGTIGKSVAANLPTTIQASIKKDSNMPIKQLHVPDYFQENKRPLNRRERRKNKRKKK